jgi:hypothetical protein
MTDNWKLYEAIMKGMDTGSIPVIPIISSASTCRDMIDKLRDAGRIYSLMRCLWAQHLAG